MSGGGADGAVVALPPELEAIIARGVIEPQELAEFLERPDDAPIKILDATFVLPGTRENPHHNYLSQRIGAAQFFDIEKISDPLSDLPHMLPSEGSFTSQISHMGINAGDVIVVYGQSGMVMGPARAWWMFRAFGHDRVCVLNGGLPAWQREGFAVESALPVSASISAQHGDFKAQLRPEIVSAMEDVRGAVRDESAHIFDARSADRFFGKSAEPRAGLLSGHIPGSRNIPCLNLVDAQSGKLKSAEDVRAAFQAVGYESGDSVIATCGSGVTACVLALALFYIGDSGCKVYDGSWSEWGRQDLGNAVEAE